MGPSEVFADGLRGARSLWSQEAERTWERPPPASWRAAEPPS